MEFYSLYGFVDKKTSLGWYSSATLILLCWHPRNSWWELNKAWELPTVAYCNLDGSAYSWLGSLWIKTCHCFGCPKIINTAFQTCSPILLLPSELFLKFLYWHYFCILQYAGTVTANVHDMWITGEQLSINNRFYISTVVMDIYV